MILPFIDRIFRGRIDWRVTAGAAIMLLSVAGWIYWNRADDNAKSRLRPPVMIMSSIPLQWGEATITQIAAGDAKTPALLDSLSTSHRSILIDDFQKLGKPGEAPLLLIQPRALAPRELVQLDDWVRKGGFAIIFADPALDWPSDLPLGDLRRPLFTSLLTPMFGHWGLELALPVDEAQLTEVQIGSFRLEMKSAGLWRKSGSKKPAATCDIRKDERLALCQVGKGQALLVADADILHEDQWTDNLITQGTIDWLDAVLGQMGSRKSLAGEYWDIEGN